MISLRRACLALLAIGGAALGSQVPAFSDQYLQSLGGRLDQARLHARRITETARDQGLTVAAYKARFAASADPVVRAQARVIAAALEDAKRLAAAYKRLVEASPGLRPLLLLGRLDRQVAAATARRFTPAAPLSFDGLLFAALGAVLALAGFLATAVGVGRLRRMELERAAAQSGGGHA